MRHGTTSTLRTIVQLEIERQAIYMRTNSRLLDADEVARLDQIREALGRRWEQRRAEQAQARV